ASSGGDFGKPASVRRRDSRQPRSWRVPVPVQGKGSLAKQAGQAGTHAGDRWASAPPVHVVNLKVLVGPSSHVGETSPQCRPGKNRPNQGILRERTGGFKHLEPRPVRFGPSRPGRPGAPAASPRPAPAPQRARTAR